MAIKKTYIDDSDTETALVKLSEYLTNTAVPKYFSKVENADGLISCYTNDDFLMMTIEYPLSPTGVTIHTRNNTSFSTKLNSTTKVFANAYQCVNGISLQISNTANQLFGLTITKDEAENTAIVLINSLYPAFSNQISTYIINENSDVFNPIKTATYDSDNFAKTVLAPLVVLGSDGNYTPNVFLQLFAHNTEQGILDIEGVKYLSNGLWCVKDK